MNWITLTENDLKTALTVREREDFGTEVTDVAVPDRVPQILADVVAEVRGYIASCQQNTLSADATKIPISMRAHALSIARWRLLTTIPRYNPGDARKAEYDAALAYFAKVATCKIRPEPADDATPNTVPSEAPSGVTWMAPGSRTGRKRMNGL